MNEKFQIVGIDGGNHEVKMYGEYGPLRFPSGVGEYHERNLVQKHGNFDIEYEFRGKRGFAGTLALAESKFNINLGGDTKAHEDHLLRVLLGLFLYSDDTVFKIVVGQPISRHEEKEKQKIKDILKGKHDITINSTQKTITILDVGVAAEGGTAYFSAPKPGLIRILDFGRSTVNLATLKDGQYMNAESYTIKRGMSNRWIAGDSDTMAKTVAIDAFNSDWGSDDAVYVIGGASNVMARALRKYFNNVLELTPRVSQNETVTWRHLGLLSESDVVRNNRLQIVGLAPVYANAVGNYRIAKAGAMG